MKMNLNVPFVDFDGTKLPENVGTIGKQLGFAAFKSSHIKGQPMTDEQKYNAYCLAMKLNGEGEVEVSKADAELLTAIAAETFNAGAFGQVMELLSKVE